MILTVRHPLAISTIFLWLGFVGAISFMGTWLEFRVPGITLPLGLGIGRLVFNTLNKVEWIFAIMIVYDLFVRKRIFQKATKILVFTVLILLIFQTFWLLPILDIRASLHITGENVSDSNTHFFYIALEVLKVVYLLILGLKLFKNE